MVFHAQSSSTVIPGRKGREGRAGVQERLDPPLRPGLAVPVDSDEKPVGLCALVSVASQ